MQGISAVVRGSSSPVPRVAGGHLWCYVGWHSMQSWGLIRRMRVDVAGDLNELPPHLGFQYPLAAISGSTGSVPAVQTRSRVIPLEVHPGRAVTLPASSVLLHPPATTQTSIAPPSPGRGPQIVVAKFKAGCSTASRIDTASVEIHSDQNSRTDTHTTRLGLTWRGAERNGAG
jgi:hypothetical protein